jgi:hypothetical protein
MEASTLKGAGYQPKQALPAGRSRLLRSLRGTATEQPASGQPVTGPVEIAPPPADVRRRGAALSRLVRLGVSDGTKSSASEAILGELEMELALLREENARLKVERHRRPDPGRIIDRMRDLRQEPHAEQTDDEVSRGIVECISLRDSLLEACQEIQQAMQGMQSRIGTLSVAVEAKSGVIREGRVGHVAVDAPIADADLVDIHAERVDLELAVSDRVASDFAESAV